MAISHLQIHIDQAAIEAFCRKWDVRELSLFGSVLRDDFREDSDLDLLVSFRTGTPPRLEAWLEMQDELEELFGRSVDLLRREVVEKSSNWIRRRNILGNLHVLYAA